ncbi:hypothetical protein [Phaeobacter gallaeciensis]|uniref:hypothetical protein n=1 Tax=Phaeobacter gallaeciensis TaxID=60890 RepID=UPI00237FAFC5|nr:hypothetical protein [Phaeobacter gallaeciensis]MDE4099697.1 hypothetical protein [Phaeobacter gallaeciensis]MDE4108568.1 hypothetical protein [Phaeobacter gallaeciensis]MDE4110416.1 hypothetical protein [Phaeobacter gallaeciensis]MDE4117338.1 hypothetical protein [Phaeobacter gallaeciensis]MDE4121811.1 hypothetical protein [Phaeobacter gallaeciensis]
MLDKLVNWWEALSQWWKQSLTIITQEDYSPLLDTNGFLGILAFSVAVFTLSSPKYQIRQATAIIPFRPFFFGVLIVSGFIIFALEAFVLYGLQIPKFLHPNAINYLTTSLIALLIFYWMKICFIRPPRFTRFTAHNFFHQTYSYIENGSREEMLAMAREIMREIPRIVQHMPRRDRFRREDDEAVKFTTVQAYSNDLLLLLSDTRFCDAVAEDVPSFPAHLVEQVVRLKRYDAPIHLIIRRIVIALLNKPGSALHVENEWLGQGLMGEVKPITRAVFSNWHLLESWEAGMESPLDLGYPQAEYWDHETWRVYFELAREYVRGVTKSGHSNWDNRGIRHILETTKRAFGDIGDERMYEDPSSPHNPYWRAREANDFIKDLVKQFDASNGWLHFDRRDKYYYGNDLSSKIASLLSETIFRASRINTKEFRMWDVQHNLVWSSIEEHEVRNTKLMKMVRRKVRRMIYDEIRRMDVFPNFKGAGYIRFCLNVLGFYDESVHRRPGLKQDSWLLAKVISDWVRKNYQTIAKSHPPVAKAMLPANIEYDQASEMLIREKEDSLTGTSRIKEFPLDPAC